MRIFGKVLIGLAVLTAGLMSFTTASVDLGYRIGGGSFARVAEPCGSVFGMLALGDYRVAVTGERPPQAQAIDPDGSSLREQCELVARARLVTMVTITIALLLFGIVLMRVGNRRNRPMDELRPLPKRST
jgi:Kef-type K+ transport system membrane component KefB